MLRHTFFLCVILVISLNVSQSLCAQEEPKRKKEKERVYLSRPDKANERPQPHIYQAPPAADSFKAPSTLGDQKTTKEEEPNLATDSVKEGSDKKKANTPNHPAIPFSEENLDPDDDEPME